MEKKCSKCGLTKPIDEFCKSTQVKSGYTAHCKLCRKVYSKSSVDRIRAKDPEAYAERLRKYTREHKKRHPESVRLADRKRHLSKFGITPDEYDSMLSDQQGKCLICFDTPNGKRFAIDHDHQCCPNKGSCGKCIRGLLCLKCNTALGLLREDENIINSMLEYLRK